ncbi:MULTISPECIES: glycosyltransferase family 9 protein [unclassified Leifsonia]|uniref:glycosyltransferase family 9 protein n=1 Tax=unclassified Leifsonia TaxID=2663824 RepID=UPI0008A7D015|nr:MULTISPECIES: glycosyltransferase family 9 protein [unclassified Leifsonia]SEH54684.1 ADP-heptose:LPS heptosyltransferase [Leifsonia sp. CL154]SFL24353.1 ADP-heptose:LPS heptosyltransferase [Leifsonia sp. CL147]
MRLLGDPDGTPEVLALRALKLGDLLVAVPAIRAIKRAHPDHRLILAVPGWLDPILDLVEGVDALLPTPGLDAPLRIQSGRVETVVNLHGAGPESRELLDALDARRKVGHRAPGWDGPEWLDGIHERLRWARLVTAHGMPADPDDVALRDPGASSRPGAAVVHVGAFYGCRQWPVERFARVVGALERDGLEVVLTGSEAERNRAVAVAERAGLPENRILAGRIGLREFASVIADARIVVSADTGAAHLASAYRVPSVIIFGPAPVEEWGPPPGPHIVLTDARLRVGDTFGAEPDPALMAVQVEDVLRAASALLS